MLSVMGLCPRGLVPSKCSSSPSKLDALAKTLPAGPGVSGATYTEVKNFLLYKQKSRCGGSGFKLNINYDSILISY